MPLLSAFTASLRVAPRAVHDDAQSYQNVFFAMVGQSALGHEGTHARFEQCPLYPPKRTWAVQWPISAIGHKRTHVVQQNGLITRFRLPTAGFLQQDIYVIFGDSC